MGIHRRRLGKAIERVIPIRLHEVRVCRYVAGRIVGEERRLIGAVILGRAAVAGIDRLAVLKSVATIADFVVLVAVVDRGRGGITAQPIELLLGLKQPSEPVVMIGNLPRVGNRPFRSLLGTPVPIQRILEVGNHRCSADRAILDHVLRT